MWLGNKSFAGESRGQVRYIFRVNQNIKGKEKYYYITLTKCRFVNIFSREDICDIIPVIPVEQWDWQRSRVISGGRLSLTSLPPFSVALTMLSVSSLRAGQHSSSTICTDTFFLRIFLDINLYSLLWKFALKYLLAFNISADTFWRLNYFLRAFVSR